MKMEMEVNEREGGGREERKKRKRHQSFAYVSCHIHVERRAKARESIRPLRSTRTSLGVLVQIIGLTCSSSDESLFDVCNEAAARGCQKVVRGELEGNVLAIFTLPVAIRRTHVDSRRPLCSYN